ncbi:MAG: DUF5107 domain-containing protein [Suipraeoptans sp.]
MSKNTKVKVWQETTIIPTYKVSDPEKAPLFIENRAYQGSSGKVYPLPVTEKISDTKEDVSYNAVYLENEYLKVMILPELGGRIQRAYDKTNDYDFVYYNHVIKPALVGLTGPWISGGIEFNWPQHHRPSTYSPVEYKYIESTDGSASVYVSEIDQMYGTKGMGIFTLYPDKAYIEIKGQLYNNTDFPQTFLWWANPAVPVNDHTYSVFPPDVTAVMDHGKRAVSTFPIATGEYYKYDYSEGIDISMYKNIEVPTSYMAAHSDYDFIGNYDSSLEAGLLHVADHHISPGKKQWTWGNADFGQAWDRALTDEDGPYIELMTGVFADNQPDFTWLKPSEEKTFTQYFMPYKKVGRVKNANKDAMYNLTVEDNNATITLYTSSKYSDLSLSVTDENGASIYNKITDIDPATPFNDTFKVDISTEVGCSITVKSSSEITILCDTIKEKKLEATPEPAEKLEEPINIKSNEELFLGGQHLEQYRHATSNPADYYEEGLRRDPTDIRINNAYGLLKMKRGQFEEAKSHFETATCKQTWKNPNPYNGECYFNLGLALTILGDDDKAYDAFYKSTWSYETQSSGFYWLAILATRKQKYEDAIAFLDKSLSVNWHNMRARTLKISLLRLAYKDNSSLINESKEIDPLYIGLQYEESLLTSDANALKDFMHGKVSNYIELTMLYLDAFLFEDALNILSLCETKSPLIHYYEGFIHNLTGNTTSALECYSLAESTSPDGCFPNKLMDICVLKDAISLLDMAPYAHYHLGNILYDRKQYKDATKHWEQSIEENHDYPMSFRNLSISYYNKEKNSIKAMEMIETAYNLDSKYSRFLLEYDQMRARNKVRPEVRLELLERELDIVKERDAIYIEYITLLNLTGQYDKALSHLQSHVFHPWEGGEGKVITQYRYALTQKALIERDSRNYQSAITLLTETLTYPKNLGEGKLPNVQDNIAEYYIGKCYQALNDNEKATEYFIKASIGMDEPGGVLYYNDQPSDTMLYQGLACEELGDISAAKKNYHQLKAYGEKHIFDHVTYDFFAVSLPELNVYQEDITDNNVTYCKYLMALSEIGLQNTDEAVSKLEEILDEHPDHQGATCHMFFVERGR